MEKIKSYAKPEVTVVVFDEDVLTTSFGPNGTNFDDSAFDGLSDF